MLNSETYDIVVITENTCTLQIIVLRMSFWSFFVIYKEKLHYILFFTILYAKYINSFIKTLFCTPDEIAYRALKLYNTS